MRSVPDDKRPPSPRQQPLCNILWSHILLLSLHKYSVLQAWVGHTFQSTAIISIHVVFGLILAAALGAHNTVVYSTFSTE